MSEGWTVLRIEEDDYGCEEPLEICVTVVLQRTTGETQYVRIPEADARCLRETTKVNYVNGKVIPE